MKESLRKGELVELESETNGKMPFPGPQAEKILNDKRNSGEGAWKLPKGSKYKLENGKLIRSTTASSDTSANQ